MDFAISLRRRSDASTVRVPLREAHLILSLGISRNQISASKSATSCVSSRRSKTPASARVRCFPGNIEFDTSFGGR